MEDGVRRRLRLLPRRRPGRRSAVIRQLCLVLGVCVLVTTCATLWPPVARQPPFEIDARSAALPFDMPPTDTLRGSPRKVFVTYFPSLPVSLDNVPPESDYYTTQYLDPLGEDGKHAAYGGHLRDRPIPRPPRPEANWRLLDLEEEVRQAIAGGIDGFYLDILTMPDHADAQVWETGRLLLEAARRVDPGFEIVLMPDLTGDLGTVDVRTLAQYVALLGSAPSAARLDDGRLVVMPLAPERHPADWWREFMEVMRTEHGIPMALVPIFIADETPYLDSFAPISHAITVWGSRSPAQNDPDAVGPTSPQGRARAVQSRGVPWVQPVSIQDERHREGLFDEALNTENLRRSWQLARETGAMWVHIPTWNDYSEGSHLAPSMKHGWTFIDINAYYLTWYKTGSPPEIVRDTIYLTHRTQPVEAVPIYPTARPMELRPWSSPPRDTVEALVFLTAPGRVTVRVGDSATTCRLPAGVSTCLAPLAPGTVRADLTRNEAVVATVTSPQPVTDTPVVQDLQYVGATSGRAPPRTVPRSRPPASLRLEPRRRWGSRPVRRSHRAR